MRTTGALSTWLAYAASRSWSIATNTVFFTKRSFCHQEQNATNAAAANVVLCRRTVKADEWQIIFWEYNSANSV